MVQMASTPLPINLLPFASPLRHLDSNQKEVRVKSGCCGALKPGMLDLSCEANECSDAETGDLGVATHWDKRQLSKLTHF